jgi:hypothetical protein
MEFACSTEHVGWKYEVSFCTYTTSITGRVLYSTNMLNGVLKGILLTQVGCKMI